MPLEIIDERAFELRSALNLASRTVKREAQQTSFLRKYNFFRGMGLILL